MAGSNPLGGRISHFLLLPIPTPRTKLPAAKRRYSADHYYEGPAPALMRDAITRSRRFGRPKIVRYLAPSRPRLQGAYGRDKSVLWAPAKRREAVLILLRFAPRQWNWEIDVMRRKYRSSVTIASLTLAALSLPALARADEPSVKAGVLTCNVASGWGFVFGSSRDLNCTYSGGGRAEHYSGTISKFGVDIGYLDGGVIVWAVLAPSSTLAPDALQGDYVGVTASLAVGVGAGANVLIGGFSKSIALQPISIEGNNGLNVAAGIGAINLSSRP